MCLLDQIHVKRNKSYVAVKKHKVERLWACGPYTLKEVWNG